MPQSHESPHAPPDWSPTWSLRCVQTQRDYPPTDLRYRSDSGSVLDVVHNLAPLLRTTTPLTAAFDQRLASKHPHDRSGVWRFRELVLPVPPHLIVARGEGNTGLYDSQSVARYAGLRSFPLKHEGENPTGSFKDRGMCVGVTAARLHHMTRVACASTGNTSASMASYAALAGLRAYVFIPSGKITFSKLAQALAYGARTIQIDGSFDDAMRLVQDLAAHHGIYLLNSVNPYRLEGQKAIALELLQDLDWQPPDWLVLPGGNLGNNAAIFKALSELHCLGIIQRFPRLAIIQAAGANPMFRLYRSLTTSPLDRDDPTLTPPGPRTWRTDLDPDSIALHPVAHPDTIATAIRIGDPVSWRKTLRALRTTNGVVEHVTDQQILDAKAVIDAAGIGAEPASCATLAGARALVASGVIKPDERVVGILTGHVLKDPDTIAAYHQATLQGITPAAPNPPVRCLATIDSILNAIRD